MMSNDVFKFGVHIDPSFALSESQASFKAKQTRKQTNKQNTGLLFVFSKF